MASSETELASDDDAIQDEPGGDTWLALRCRVAEAQKDLVGAFLFSLGSRGLTEEHAGLDLGDDGPLISGDPGEWAPEAPSSPDGHVLLTGWFLGSADGEQLLAATGARMTELRIQDPPTLERVVSEDWNAAWKKDYASFRVSPHLWIVPTWEEPPSSTAGSEVLRIDPGMAFGTGTHFTTSACTRLLDDWISEGRPAQSLLDVGTGTGILALGGLLLGVPRAVGVDTSPEAVAAARENAAQNGLTDRFEVVLGGVRAAPGGAYPVVMANLLAPLLVRLARPLAERVASGGALIASGLLERQEDQVVQALQAVGLTVTRRIADGDWCALQLEPR
jgi:ribosomal protein L11 methyltransferase